MYISVLPFSHSFSLEPFTYHVPSYFQESIVMGGIIEIPFGKKTDIGIVAGVIEDASLITDISQIKDIISIMTSYPLLAPYQIAMILHICLRSYIPVHVVLRMFLPSPLMSHLEKRSYLIDLPKSEGIIQNKTIRFYHIHTPFSVNSPNFPLEDGTVWIFPDDFFLYTYTASLDKDDVLILPSEATPAKKTRAWKDIFSGKYRILFGTRRLLYYNLSAYKKVYYLEDAFSREEYQYPYSLKNNDILRIFADTSPLSLTIASSTPTLDIIAKFRDTKIETLS